MCSGIKHFDVVNGIPNEPTRGYHETMTVAWLRIIHATIQIYGRAESSEALVGFHAQLGETKNLRLFYSPQLIMSPLAKQQFVEPDLAPLPQFTPQQLNSARSSFRQKCLSAGSVIWRRKGETKFWANWAKLRRRADSIKSA
jgi:hypothetical protein